jgi:hypothetical protein
VNELERALLEVSPQEALGLLVLVSPVWLALTLLGVSITWRSVTNGYADGAAFFEQAPNAEITKLAVWLAMCPLWPFLILWALGEILLEALEPLTSAVVSSLRACLVAALRTPIAATKRAGREARTLLSSAPRPRWPQAEPVKGGEVCIAPAKGGEIAMASQSLKNAPVETTDPKANKSTQKLAEPL